MNKKSAFLIPGGSPEARKALFLSPGAPPEGRKALFLSPGGSLMLEKYFSSSLKCRFINSRKFIKCHLTNPIFKAVLLNKDSGFNVFNVGLSQKKAILCDIAKGSIIRKS